VKLSFIVPPGLKDMPAAELGAWAARVGFEAVDSETEWSREETDELQAAGLTLGPMRIRASLADSDPETRRQAVETACAAIDHAAHLGLTDVWTLPRNFRNDRTIAENFRAALDSLPAVVEYAEARGIRIAIENCPFEGQNPICTPEAWDALFAAIPSANLGICLDPSHCEWQGIDVRRVIREYADRIFHAHAKDTEIVAEGLYRFGVQGPQLGEGGTEDGWPRHGWWRHRLPGLGSVDWNGFVTGLADISYDGYLTLEHEDPLWGGSPERIQRGFERSYRYLSSLIP
jgi:sugar phosphate isomerase/epimerase